MKIVINTCYGGFHPSAKAILRWAELSGMELHLIKRRIPFKREMEEIYYYDEIPPEEESRNLFYMYYSTKPLNPDGTIVDNSYWYYDDEIRIDPYFIQAVEELGEEANSHLSDLKVIEIPDDIEWEIEDYDGIEWVSEKHRTWS